MDELIKIRRQIDRIDAKIALLLKERENNIQKIKKVKKNNHLPRVDREREALILEKLDSKYQKDIFRKIIALSRKM